MVDNLTKVERSKRMALIRSSNTKAEPREKILSKQEKRQLRQALLQAKGLSAD